MKRTTRLLVLAACWWPTACATIAGLEDVPKQENGAASDAAPSPDATVGGADSGADGGTAGCTPCVLGTATLDHCCL